MYFNPIAALVSVVLMFSLFSGGIRILSEFHLKKRRNNRESVPSGYPEKLLQLRQVARAYDKFCFPSMSRGYWAYNVLIILFLLVTAVLSGLYASGVFVRFQSEFGGGVLGFGVLMGLLPFIKTGWYQNYKRKSNFRRYRWLRRKLGSVEEMVSLYLLARSVCGEATDSETPLRRMSYGARFFVVPGSILFTFVPVIGLSSDALFLWLLCVYSGGATVFLFLWFARLFRRADWHGVSPCKYYPVRMLLSDLGWLSRM